MSLFGLLKKSKNISSSSVIAITTQSFNEECPSNSSIVPNSSFPITRYNNANDMFSNIYCSSSKFFKVSDNERVFIDSFLESLNFNNLECACLLSRMSNGELVVYYKILEVGRIKLNGSRNYLTVSNNVSKHYEAKTMNFYISKMKQYWIPYILHNVSTKYI